MPAVPVPVRASVRDLLRDLLGTGVTVTEGQPQVLDPERPAYCSVYERDDGEPVAAVVTDLTLAAAMGGAIGMMSAADVAEELGDATALDGDLLEFFREVVNVFARLLNSPTTQHVKLTETTPLPGELPRSAADVVLSPRARVDWGIAVEGHEPGTITLVAS